jgi:transcriptional regulator with XRE-family HTH domain
MSRPAPAVLRADSTGSRIRKTRQERGMILDDLALESGVSKTGISQLENDQCSPMVETIVALAEALGVRPGWLIEGDVEPYSDLAPTAIPADLATYAAATGLSFRVVATLIDLRKALAAHGFAKGEPFDWGRLHTRLEGWLDG